MNAHSISTPRADHALVGGTQFVYGLHVAAALGALFGAASLPGALLFAAPLVLALTLNLLLRAQMQGTQLESHLRWQMRSASLGLALLVLLAAGAWLIASAHLAGFALLLAGKLVLAAWLGYRGVRGWIALARGGPVGQPAHPRSRPANAHPGRGARPDC